MLKKISYILFLAYLLMMIGGCVSSANVGIDQPQVKPDPQVTQPLEKFDQLTAEERKNASQGGDDKSGNNQSGTQSTANQEDLEMKHWKYNRDQSQYSTSANTAAQSSSASSSGQSKQTVSSTGINYSTDNGDGQPATIQLLTEEDVQSAVNQLVKLGYLAEKKVTEGEFKSALIKFQSSQKLTPTGLLDKETLNLLSTQAGKL